MKKEKSRTSGQRTMLQEAKHLDLIPHTVGSVCTLYGSYIGRVELLDRVCDLVLASNTCKGIDTPIETVVVASPHIIASHNIERQKHVLSSSERRILRAVLHGATNERCVFEHTWLQRVAAVVFGDFGQRQMCVQGLASFEEQELRNPVQAVVRACFNRGEL